MTLPSLAEYYHEQTKYTPESLSRAGRGLDFDHKPALFKDYPDAALVDLVPFLPDDETLRDDEDLVAWRQALPESQRVLAELSHLFYYTNGVTAVMPQPGESFLMRAAPSAGGLYPTELYVAAKGVVGLADGLYNYQVRDHALAAFWTADVWARLRTAAFDHPALEQTGLVIIATGVFERSAWRYEDRAYRRVLLDSGHVLGNLELVAPSIGRHVVPIGGFDDIAVNELLLLDPAAEGALALAALIPSGVEDAGPTALAGPRHPQRDVPEGERILALHEAGHIETAPEAAPAAASPDAAPEATPAEKFTIAFGEPFKGLPFAWEGLLASTIARRRSTRAFSGEALTRAELATLLEFTYRPDLMAASDIHEAHPRYFAPELLETFVAVNDVEGLDPGCYHYNPARRELRQIRFTGLQREVRYLALGQDLAGQASAVVFHTADLPRAVDAYGDRAYRYLHLDAGHLGERLNLAAIRMGLGVSGIGGFFDDQVNDMLGIPEREAVLYLTTLGRPRTR